MPIGDLIQWAFFLYPIAAVNYRIRACPSLVQDLQFMRDSKRLQSLTGSKFRHRADPTPQDLRQSDGY